MSDWTWPKNPNGDMAPILNDSIEAAKARHPSGVDVVGLTNVVLDNADRCDSQCGAAAAYRVGKEGASLDFCLHHWRKVFPMMQPKGWVVIGGNPSLLAELT